MASQPNPVNGYPPDHDAIPSQTVPAGLDLLQVHIYARHGERTPVRERLGHLGIPARWDFCSAGREMAAGVKNDPKEGGKTPEAQLMLLRRRIEHSRGNRSELASESECLLGQLTDVGRLSTLRLGKQLRALYVDKLGFLPQKLEKEHDGLVSFRSTAVPRAFESLQQMVHGLYPVQASLVPTFTVRTPGEESLYPNTLCPTLKQLDRASAKRAAERYDGELLEPLDSKIAKVVGTPVRIGSHPSANGVFDTVKSAIAHGLKVPSELTDPSVTAPMEKAIVHEWFDGYLSKQFKRLAMGRLLGDLSTSLQDRIARGGSDKLRLAIYACHDTSLGGILNALDVHDGRWPAFTAYITFELFQRAGNPAAPRQQEGWLAKLGLNRSSAARADMKDYYVRAKYNTNDLKLPGCSQPDQHLAGSEGTVCTLQAFTDAVKEISMTAEQWEKACKLPVESQ